MKPLSRYLASRCEDGKGQRCRCRCGGQFHGARRNVDGAGMPVLELEDLPLNDPHRVEVPKGLPPAVVPLRGEQLVLPGMPEIDPEWVPW